MIRGTTPTLVLRLPQEIAFDRLYVTFSQRGSVVVEKTLDDVAIDGAQIAVPLTQADTLAFAGDTAVELQLRATASGMAYASRIVRVAVSDILKDGEI